MYGWLLVIHTMFYSFIYLFIIFTYLFIVIDYLHQMQGSYVREKQCQVAKGY